MTLLLQHALILAGTVTYTTLVGWALNRLLGGRLNRIEVHVNGRLSALEKKVKGDGQPRMESQGDRTRDA